MFMYQLLETSCVHYTALKVSNFICIQESYYILESVNLKQACHNYGKNAVLCKIIALTLSRMCQTLWQSYNSVHGAHKCALSSRYLTNMVF